MSEHLFVLSCAFYFIFCLYFTEWTVEQWWIEMIKVDIVALFMILEGKHSFFTIKCDVNSGFFLDSFYQLVEDAWYLLIFLSYGYWILLSAILSLLKWLYVYSFLVYWVVNFMNCTCLLSWTCILGINLTWWFLHIASFDF